MLQINKNYFSIFSMPGLHLYLRLAQPQLNPLQRLAEDATLLLLHAAALQRRSALFRLLQALQQTAVLSSQRLQSCYHLLGVAQNLLCRQHGCSSEVPLHTTADLENTRRHWIGVAAVGTAAVLNTSMTLVSSSSNKNSIISITGTCSVLYLGVDIIVVLQ